jgi:hypothetical protein
VDVGGVVMVVGGDGDASSSQARLEDSHHLSLCNVNALIIALRGVRYPASSPAARHLAAVQQELAALATPARRRATKGTSGRQLASAKTQAAVRLQQLLWELHGGCGLQHAGAAATSSTLKAQNPPGHGHGGRGQEQGSASGVGSVSDNKIRVALMAQSNVDRDSGKVESGGDSGTGQEVRGGSGIHTDVDDFIDQALSELRRSPR